MRTAFHGESIGAVNAASIAGAKDGDIVASEALPPGFPATRIDDTYYWDGGMFSNTPIDALLNLLEPDAA